MKKTHSRRRCARSLLYASMTLGAVTLAPLAWADNDNDQGNDNGNGNTPRNQADAKSMRLLGHNDMQNRPIYQPTVHK